jgi:hypothetical protein
MNSNSGIGSKNPAKTKENIAYLRQMLGELRLVARNEGADMLCYLIEMAYVEAGDLQAGRRPLNLSSKPAKDAGALKSL